MTSRRFLHEYRFSGRKGLFMDFSSICKVQLDHISTLSLYRHSVGCMYNIFTKNKNTFQVKTRIAAHISGIECYLLPFSQADNLLA